jgi:hypothetical protein
MKFVLTISLISILFSSCSEPNEEILQEEKPEEYILDEEFNNNSLGWVEEKTTFHNVDIAKGEYFIASLDSSEKTLRSSSGSLDKSYLLGLPYSYEITSEMEFLGTDLEFAYFGFHLYSATVDYIFCLYNDKELIIREHDYNLDTSTTIVQGNYDGIMDESITFKLEVEGNDFQFYLNDQKMGGGNYKCQSWNDLRLYTSKQSKISIKNLKIKEK